ncbi:response regulator [Comamonas sp. JUb58]|uniref:response regulator transcription factor n=1 Tax=Comamonas sp. JUb58 TaxID=2485114 RepID=UPI001060CA91|nr:response regulator [Comamonas sp. JUb58]TDS85230.1 helix-turn-helix protein [Comamonas sp. JUb58]
MSNADIPSPHVLIVDDDPDQLRLLVAALRNTSYRVSVALNGDQGYARAAVLLPDLILLDVRMPGRNGITIARLLKTNPATQHIPIIFLSAMVEQDDRLSGLRAGGVDYITKPFFVEEIQERVRIHLMLAQQNLRLTQDGPLAQPDRAVAPPSQSPANLTLKQVATEYILGHIQDPELKSSDVAASLGLSMRRLNMVFETSDGLSAFEFIRQERMRRAALMLAQSTLSIADVALEVGYLNSANFSTEFKKFWQKSPTQLRTECQADPEVLQNLVASKFH